MGSTASVQKIFVLGLPETGKTQIINKYVSNGYESIYRRSNKISASKLAVNIGHDGETYTIINLIWDVPGSYLSGDLMSLSKQMKNASGIIGVYDYTNPQTFGKLESILKKSADIVDDKPIVFAANKADIVTLHNRQRRLPENHLYTSAKTGENIKELFIMLNRMLLDKI